jgi:hypothetical protein
MPIPSRRDLISEEELRKIRRHGMSFRGTGAGGTWNYAPGITPPPAQSPPATQQASVLSATPVAPAKPGPMRIGAFWPQGSDVLPDKPTNKTIDVYGRIGPTPDMGEMGIAEGMTNALRGGIPGEGARWMHTASVFNPNAQTVLQGGVALKDGKPAGPAPGRVMFVKDDPYRPQMVNGIPREQYDQGMSDRANNAAIMRGAAVPSGPGLSTNEVQRIQQAAQSARSSWMKSPE